MKEALRKLWKEYKKDWYDSDNYKSDYVPILDGFWTWILTGEIK